MTAYNFGRMGRITKLHRSNKKRLGRNGLKKNKNTHRTSSNANTTFLGDDILVNEILTRLPSKSLMRFKSVCRHWLSLIQHDPHFHAAHFNRRLPTPSCQLLLLLPVYIVRPGWNNHGLQECFFSADLDHGRASVGTISKTESFEPYSGILNPVKGLICFFKYGSVCIYNPATRAITPWICSMLEMEVKNKLRCPIYGFGFDPTTKEHKVICMWRGESPVAFVACEILSLGHDKWRRIDEVPPPYEIDQKRSLYVNGSIYWIYSKSWIGKSCKSVDKPLVIIAFDVGSEKFRVIPVPSFILDHRCDGLHPTDLLEVDEGLALLQRTDGHTVKLWKYFDNHNYGKKKNMSATNTNWSQETIELPFCWDQTVSKLSFHGVARTDQLIVRSVASVKFGKWLLSLYSYDRKTQSFKKVEINGISSISDPTYSLFTHFVESVFPVSNNTTLTLDLNSEFQQDLRGPFPFGSFFWPRP